MKIIVSVLLVSLVLNATLTVVYFARRSASVAVHPSAKDLPRMTAAPLATERGKPGPDTWDMLRGGSDADFVARLRAEGFPPGVVRRLVVAVLNERFRERRKPFDLPEPGYWQTQSGKRYIDAELIPARRALEQEWSEAYHALLGADAYAESDAATRRQYGDLPPETIARIKAIHADYAEMTLAVRAAAKGVRLPEDEAKLAYLEKEKRADLAQILTAEEFAAYDLRSSATANALRGQLRAFEPSEDEFVALFHAQREVERELASRGRNITPDEARELREARVQAVLDPERFDDYQITTAGEFGDVTHLVEHLQLPATATAETIRTKRDVTQRASTLRNDPQLSPEQQQIQLAALHHEARAKLTAILGTEGFNQYVVRVGRWLEELPPPPKPTG